MQLNTNTEGCTSPVIVTGRVIVASARAIVVADTSNPPGGFSDADYARIAVTYDTLVAAAEDAAFGTPTDLDANGKVQGDLFQDGEHFNDKGYALINPVMQKFLVSLGVGSAR